jgi:hypothetical protein
LSEVLHIQKPITFGMLEDCFEKWGGSELGRIPHDQPDPVI